MTTNGEPDEFVDFDPMAEDYVKTLNSNYFGGPGFALPDVQNGSKPLNILVEGIPEDLTREGLVRAFRLSNVFPISCKLFHFKGSNKATLQVTSITEATTAIQALNKKPPLNLKVTLAADQEDFEIKKNQIQREQRAELARHLRSLAKPINKMGELVNNLCAVENLFKILSTRDEMCQVCTEERLIRHVHFIVSEEIVIDPFQDLPQSLEVNCTYCGTKDGKFVVCSKCRITSYCGLRCQSLDWLSHRKTCSPHPKIFNGDSPHSPDGSTEIKNPSSPKVQVSPKKPKVNAPRDVKPDKVAMKASEKHENVEKIEKLHRPEPIKIEPKIQKITSPVKVASPPKPRRPEPIQIEQKVSKITSPVKVASPPKVENPPVNDNNASKVKHQANNNHHNPVNNPTSYIQEPNRIIRPRQKISLNNEVNYIKETKLDINAVTEVVFSFCCSPSEFYVQKSANTPEAEAITDKLMEVCSQADAWPEANKLVIGNYCACKYESDGCWYRAKVIGFKNDNVEVKYIDYGNKDVVPFTALRPLPPELVAVPALAVKCALKFVKPLFEGSGWNKEASKFFENCLLGDDIEFPYSNCMVFSEYDGLHQVELSNEKGEKLNDLLVQKGHALRYEEIRKPMQSRMARRNPDLRTPSPPEEKPPQNPPIEKSKGQPKPNAVVDVSPPRPPPVKELSPGEAFNKHCLQKSPATYYHLYNMATIKEDEAVLLYNDVDDPAIVYLLGSSSSMLKLCGELGNIEQKSTHITPKPGTFAVAPAEDGDFYRVLILDVEGDKSRVFFLDFGNKDLVANSDFLKLPEKISLEKIPAQAIRCRIENFDEIENYSSKLADQISNGNLVSIKVVRKISEHEYAILLN